jgi:hypothetical protein
MCNLRLTGLATATLWLLTAVVVHSAEEVRRFDKNRDGKYDQWEYYQDGVLLRVEVDRNRDGGADETTFYEAGRAVWAGFDTTSQGRVNQWLFYNAEGQVIRAEYDHHATGRPSQ